MSYNGCSGNFSSRSFRGYLPSSWSSCGNSFPSNLVYRTRTNCCSPSTCQLGSSLHGGCQETCIEPTNCQRSCVVTSPCQPSCYYPRSSSPCTPCQTPYGRSLGFGSSSFRTLGCGSRRCCSVGCGSSGFRPRNYGLSGFPSLNYSSSFCYPTYLAPRICQSSYC
uniref:keratin-associated protein 13-1-like n=1 Tax=Jaculus jaculus TaxID=51337 RepID=UPI001E1B4C71|nr:keratin-associated protein 13-1-like [Jaculus jaculus]